VRLDWGSESNDYDLYIFDDATTSQVASSGNGTTTFEDATFTPVAGRTYEVLIVHFAAAPGDNINGSASLVNPPTVTNASRIGPTRTGIVFSRNGIIPGGQGAPDAGGGDIEIAVSFPRSFTPTLAHPPTLSMVSLTLANITASASTNRGNDWSPVNPVAAAFPADDRQWIEAYGDNTVYLNYRTLATLTGLVLDKSI